MGGAPRLCLALQAPLTRPRAALSAQSFKVESLLNGDAFGSLPRSLERGGALFGAGSARRLSGAGPALALAAALAAAPPAAFSGTPGSLGGSLTSGGEWIAAAAAAMHDLAPVFDERGASPGSLGALGSGRAPFGGSPGAAGWATRPHDAALKRLVLPHHWRNVSGEACGGAGTLEPLPPVAEAGAGAAAAQAGAPADAGLPRRHRGSSDDEGSSSEDEEDAAVAAARMRRRAGRAPGDDYHAGGAGSDSDDERALFPADDDDDEMGRRPPAMQRVRRPAAAAAVRRAAALAADDDAGDEQPAGGGSGGGDDGDGDEAGGDDDFSFDDDDPADPEAAAAAHAARLRLGQMVLVPRATPLVRRPAGGVGRVASAAAAAAAWRAAGSEGSGAAQQPGSGRGAGEDGSETGGSSSGSFARRSGESPVSPLARCGAGAGAAAKNPSAVLLMRARASAAASAAAVHAASGYGGVTSSGTAAALAAAGAQVLARGVMPGSSVAVASAAQRAAEAAHEIAAGAVGRRCVHCGSNKTPQWRAGPAGAKTLCNACGVRYKNGRLQPIVAFPPLGPLPASSEEDGEGRASPPPPQRPMAVWGAGGPLTSPAKRNLADSETRPDQSGVAAFMAGGVPKKPRGAPAASPAQQPFPPRSAVLIRT